jgi:hypothetical protein
MTPKMPYKKIQTSQSLSCDHSLELKKNISTPCIDKKHE